MMADELIGVIGHPGWTAFDLLPTSNKTCQWRCPEPRCRYEYPAPPSRRSGQSSGCPRWARQRTAAARVCPKPGKSLQDMHVVIASDFGSSTRRP
ncbi:zinc-ribbon domain-containing protein [Streptomyces sp. NPDC058476]|uniref:zinc-ribbon domain-containing protein n=1 Tax=Streptomyces sp. NPDC058476 TaxID=3346519 RepID=UPI00364A3732